MRTIFVLLVAILAAPAFASDTVDVNCTCPEGSNEVTVRYFLSGTDPCHIRAFALDIFLDNPDADIVSVHGYDPFVDDYYIYPGSIDVNTDTNDIDDHGDPVANVAMYPYATCGTRPGRDSNAMTIEMGSLYVGESNAPADSNILFKFIVSASTNIIISENAKRGGIVMEPNGHSPTSINFSTCQADLGCFPSDHPDYSEWQTVGEPNSWCYPRQCHGDATNEDAGDPKDGYFWVLGDDLAVLIEGWNQPYSGSETQDGDDPGSDPDTWIAADFAHREAGDPKDGYFRVLGDDLAILIANWMSNPDPNCLTEYTPVP